MELILILVRKSLLKKYTWRVILDIQCYYIWFTYIFHLSYLSVLDPRSNRWIPAWHLVYLLIAQGLLIIVCALGRWDTNNVLPYIVVEKWQTPSFKFDSNLLQIDYNWCTLIDCYPKSISQNWCIYSYAFNILTGTVLDKQTLTLCQPYLYLIHAQFRSNACLYSIAEFMTFL